MRSFAPSRTLLLTAGLALCLAWFCTRLTSSFARPAPIEPPLEFQLQVGAQSVPVALDEEFTVTLGGQAVRMTLRVAPDRLFDNADGVRFRYPKDMVFEYDGTTPDMQMWTFDGNNCVLMLFRFRAPGVDPDELRASVFGEIVSKFDRRNTEVSESRLVLGGRTLKGSRLIARVAGEPIQQDFVAFAHGKDVFVLSVQDSLTESGGTTAETLAVKALLARTFKLPE